MRKPADIFKALSDETRLKIMILLSAGELCVCDLERILATTQTKISRHLSVLKYNNLVKSRREGQWSYYSLAEFEDEFTRSILVSCELIKEHYFPDFEQTVKKTSNCSNSKS